MIQEGRAISGTLIVAIIALVVSVSGLSWQIILYLLGGARVRAELHIGVLGPGIAVHGPAERHLDFPHLAQQGLDELVFAVQVSNKGRSAVSVTKWQVAFDNGGGCYFHRPGWHVNDDRPLPYRAVPLGAW